MLADGSGQVTVHTTGLPHPNGLALDKAGSLFMAGLRRRPRGEGPRRRRPADDRAHDRSVPADQPDVRPRRGPVRLPQRQRPGGAVGGGRQRTVPAIGLNSPYGLVFDPAGALHIADFDNGRVVKLPVRGGRRTVPVAGLRTPAGLATSSGREGY
ncbi:hypothetical protein [Streptomyces globisporus]|uniref:hypothetical protein n=1 Tax=Streptomyces globisporus TaxID=1908 RepID=UPI000ADFC4EA|nr:hypothetical protein [Streptomyces globisporus]